MAKFKTSYVCSSCGSVSPKWLGKCPDCASWNTFVEEVEETGASKNKEGLSKHKPTAIPVTLSTIEGLETSRFKTNMNELDQVLGGGIVKGSVVLIGGEPGIGKSTVMLQVAGLLSGKSKRVLYVSGEESPAQIRLRADRLSIKQDKLKLLATTSLEDVLYAADTENYEYIILDSIQTVSSADLQSSGGTVGQVRHVTYRLVELAKSTGITVFIVGQVTKDGAIAGPKVLEHLVDTVLYFEGDYSRGVRILRCVKNRFGSTDEVGIFEMSSKGLLEAGNKIFINMDAGLAAGKVICSVLEGSRPFLVEIQALVAPTFFQFPKRNATGFDINRLTMLIAILEKRGSINLSGADVYLNIAGGIRINEPAADLAVCATLASSFADKPITFDKVFAGEVGLTGEIRPIPNIQSRINEAIRFGVKEFIGPTKNEKSESIKLINVNYLEDMVKIIK